MHREGELEIIFSGTGTSSSLPQIACLTAPSQDPPCETCLSTLHPDGKRNIRRNTGAILRQRRKQDNIDIAPKDVDTNYLATEPQSRDVVVVIDIGKNFIASALEWFPKYGLRKIDAVLLTHSHADAINGLDDLRGWTLNMKIQDHIDIYLSGGTFNEVKRSFPYLVSKDFATGGGDVPEFRWNIITDGVPFNVENVFRVTPIAVHHGRHFATSNNVHFPPITTPSTPLPSQPPSPIKTEPYVAFGFIVNQDLVYISDVSHIPDETWAIIKPTNQLRQYAVLVVDCLRILPHTSHFGIQQAMEAARRVGATRTYLTGFTHDVSHEDWVQVGKVVGGTLDRNQISELVGKTLEEVEGERLWVRPAFDGLRVFVRQEEVRDEAYESCT